MVSKNPSSGGGDHEKRRFISEVRAGREYSGKLTTSERVLARITDGIYRQPSSAIRELVSNAYDADATEVFINTDMPRFANISVRDNGNGLSVESLENLLHSIGGSPKRTVAGAKLGVTHPKYPNLSPSGRRLIGKIGIGLFSVAQLTHHFQVITKQKGDKFRLVADVILKTYTEADLAIRGDGRETFETGSFQIHRVPATDIDSHGTEIRLLKIRPNSQDILQSRDRWIRLEGESDDETPLQKPSYHIGCVRRDNPDRSEEPARLPWEDSDDARQRFRKLHKAVFSEYNLSTSKPKLSVSLDNYLQMLWTLGLACPVDYLDRHPFDLELHDGLRFFQLANDSKGQAKELKLAKDQSLREKVELLQPIRGNTQSFEVVIDGVQLFRPITFLDQPKSQNSVKDSLMFVGKFASALSSIPKEIRGGGISFEAYFYWNSKIVPTEHQGVMVRIGDASGALFDETFMKYPVSEQTRLRQITAEVFVADGVDPALNIDRESFNFVHPHYVVLRNWIHSALRQVATRHKSIGKDIRESNRTNEAEVKKSNVAKIVREEIRKAPNVSKNVLPTKVEFTSTPQDTKKLRGEGMIALPWTNFADLMAGQKRKGARNAQDEDLLKEQLKSLAQLLDAYGILENLSYSEQQSLLRAIARIFRSET